MPVVFVHGVSVRRDAQYDEGVKIRNRYFQTIAFPERRLVPKVTLLNPYWGIWGAFLGWDSACVPPEGGRTFGASPAEVFAALWSEVAPDVLAPQGQMLLTLCGSTWRGPSTCYVPRPDTHQSRANPIPAMN